MAMIIPLIITRRSISTIAMMLHFVVASRASYSSLRFVTSQKIHQNN
jgi:hypothetical protein